MGDGSGVGSTAVRRLEEAPRGALTGEAGSGNAPVSHEVLGLGILVAAISVLAGTLAGASPVFALAAACTVVTIAVALTSRILALSLFVLVMFLDGAAAEVGVPHLAKAMGLLVVLTWLAGLAAGEPSRDLAAAHPGLVALLVGFVGWAALSVVRAPDAVEGLTAVSRYGLNFLLFPIVYGVVRSQRDVERVLGAFLLGAVAAALAGFASGEPGTGAQLERLSGGVLDPNELASFLVAALLVAVALGSSARPTPGKRAATLLAAVVCVLGILFTASRGGLIALGVVTVAGVLVAGRWRRAVLGVGLGVAVAVAVYFVAFAPPELSQRLTSADGGSGRVDIWTVGWRMVEAHPLAGVGVGGYEASAIEYGLRAGSLVRDEFVFDTPMAAHNTYLHVVAELGFIGGLGFLAVVGCALGYLWRAAEALAHTGARTTELTCRMVLLAILGLLVANTFISQQYSGQFWLLCALCPALLAISRERPAVGAGHR